ncbi:uncharacterized protein LOC115879394 [Sitophilus oryzae]|uniref:Regulatory protein zeste n=1 Tax=Sitophilus oryzae TaxID=7048 RepID=A0A6J2XL95_SITOR|nr:uncharacterized protein LOC115879394 [Sitophilus oryzae]
MERDFKTHPMQWRVIIDYMEENPSLIRPKFGHSDGDANANNQLWNQLATKLNAMGFGVRTVEKWKAAVTRWKSKVKSKAAQLRIEGEKTGGGPSKAIPLNDTEERLMALLGWRAATGDKNVELGMPQPQTPPATESSMSIPPLTPITPVRASSSSIRAAENRTAAPAPKRIRHSTERTRRFVSLNRMHTETQEQSAQHYKELSETLKRIEANTERFASALERVANVLETIVPNVSVP